MKNLVALFVIILAGCAHTEVLDLGAGRHSLTASASSLPGAHEEAVQQAQEFCDQLHAKAIVDRFEDFPADLQTQSSIIFRCE